MEMEATLLGRDDDTEVDGSTGTETWRVDRAWSPDGRQWRW
jgi:hypothetical protein